MELVPGKDMVDFLKNLDRSNADEVLEKTKKIGK